MPNQHHMRLNEDPTADTSKANYPCLSDNLTTLPLIARRQATIPQHAVQPLRRPPAPRYHRSYIGQPPSIPTADHHHPGGYAPVTTSTTDPNTIPALNHIATNISRSGGYYSVKLIATRPHHPAKAKAIQRSTLNNDAPTHTSNTPTHNTSSRPLTQDDRTQGKRNHDVSFRNRTKQPTASGFQTKTNPCPTYSPVTGSLLTYSSGIKGSDTPKSVCRLSNNPALDKPVRTATNNLSPHRSRILPSHILSPLQLSPQLTNNNTNLPSSQSLRICGQTSPHTPDRASRHRTRTATSSDLFLHDRSIRKTWNAPMMQLLHGTTQQQLRHPTRPPRPWHRLRA